MIKNILIALLVTLLVFLDVSFRDFKKTVGVLTDEITTQQQYLEAVHGVLLNHRNNIEALLKRLNNSII